MGMILSLMFLNMPRPAKEMDDREFLIHILAHCFYSLIFGIASWGLLP